MGKPDINFEALAKELEPIALSIRDLAQRVKLSNEKDIKGLDIVGRLARNEEKQSLVRQEAISLLSGCTKIADLIVRYMIETPQWKNRAEETGAEICYLVFDCLRAYKNETEAGYLKLFFKKYADKYPKDYREIRERQEAIPEEIRKHKYDYVRSINEPLKEGEVDPVEKYDAAMYWQKYYAEEINDGFVELVKKAFSLAKTENEKKYLKYYLTWLVIRIGGSEELAPYVDSDYVAQYPHGSKEIQSVGDSEEALAKYLCIQPRAWRDWRRKGTTLMLQARQLCSQ